MHGGELCRRGTVASCGRALSKLLLASLQRSAALCRQQARVFWRAIHDAQGSVMLGYSNRPGGLLTPRRPKPACVQNGLTPPSSTVFHRGTALGCCALIARMPSGQSAVCRLTSNPLGCPRDAEEPRLACERRLPPPGPQHPQVKRHARHSMRREQNIEAWSRALTGASIHFHPISSGGFL